MNDIDQAITELIPPERSGGMLVGVLVGALAGALAAALLAPQSGTVTRDLLRERGLELKDRADDLLRSRRAPL
ncbi:MAG: YtxH domain-containing protein [Chloroflexales bacterium]